MKQQNQSNIENRKQNSIRVCIAEEKPTCNEAGNEKCNKLNKNLSGKHYQQNGICGKQRIRRKDKCRGLGSLGKGQYDLKNRTWESFGIP